MEICNSSVPTPRSEVSPAVRISAGEKVLDACGNGKSAGGKSFSQHIEEAVERQKEKSKLLFPWPPIPASDIFSYRNLDSFLFRVDSQLKPTLWPRLRQVIIEPSSKIVVMSNRKSRRLADSIQTARRDE